MAVRIEIQGANALIKGLQELSSSVEQIVSEEVEIGTEDIRTDAVANVPVDTGLLRASINAESSGMAGEVYTKTPYAGYQEFGTGGDVDIPEGWEQVAEQYRGRGERTVNMPPQPFMNPAFERNAPKIVERINDRIKDELK